MNSIFQIDPQVAARFPHYHGVVIRASGVQNGPSDARSVELLRDAEAHARRMFSVEPPAAHENIAAWRDAFRAFGAKPNRMMNSAEALITRVIKGGELPAINRLADAYNAISVRYVIPCGGEDLAHVAPPVRLKFADGTEPFETVKDGVSIVDHPEPGEVVWSDMLGVTCRAWNWRQGKRTRLTADTTAAYFLLDGISRGYEDTLLQAADALEALILEVSPECVIERESIGQASADGSDR